MSVENFLRSPRDYKLRIGNNTYFVDVPLIEYGDDPAFVSYPIRTESDPPECRVIKLMKLSGPETPHTEVTQDRLKKIKARIESKRDKAKHLEQITKKTRSVPHIFEEPVTCISEENEQIGDYALVREFIKGTILSKWMAEYEKKQSPPAACFAGIRDVNQWFQLARKLVRALEPIHNERLVHGDLRPRNIILEGIRPGDIDISEARVMFLDTEEDGPEQFPSAGIETVGTFRRRYDSPQRLFEKFEEKNGPFRARKNNAQWFAPTDLFSLGIILFVLACGTAREAQLGPFVSETLVEESVGRDVNCPTWFKIGSYEAKKTNRQLKSALLEVWENTLCARLGIPEKSEITRMQWTRGKQSIIRMGEVILACLRSHTDASVAYLRAIERIIDEFDPAYKPNFKCANKVSGTNDTVTAKSSVLLQNALWLFFETETAQLPELVRQIVYRRGHRFVRSLDELTEDPNRGPFRITGRPNMVDTMVNLIVQLRPGDSCRALLTPNFFNTQNMGLFGRVTSSLQLAAMSGVQLEWIILVNEEHQQNRDVAEVLQQQRTAAQFLNGLDEASAKPYGLYYAVINSAEYGKRVLQDRLTSILITATQPRRTDILVAPDYHGDGGEISALRIWSEPDPLRWEELSKAFDFYERVKLRVTAFNR